MIDNYISVSQLNLYRQCPYRYKLNYIDKIPIEVKPDALNLGSTIHELLEQDIYTIKDEKLNPYLTNARELLSLINDIETLDCLPQNELKLYGKILGNDAVGIIDKVWKDQNIAIDYKTGSLKSGWDQRKRSKVMYGQEDYCLQAYFYDKLYEQNFGKPLKSFYFLFLGNKEFWSPNIQGKKFGEYAFDLWCEKQIEETLECINSCLFDKEESKLCNWCDYLYVCELDF